MFTTLTRNDVVRQISCFSEAMIKHCRIPKRVVEFVGDFTSGAILGALISTLFFPVNVVKQRMQSTVGTPYLSPLVVFDIVWKERNNSAKELFRGVHLNFTRYIVFPFIYLKDKYLLQWWMFFSVGYRNELQSSSCIYHLSFLITLSGHEYSLFITEFWSAVCWAARRRWFVAYTTV